MAGHILVGKRRRIMRAGMLAGILFFLGISGCSHGANDSSIDPAAAKRLSDSFMEDVIAHRTDAALDKMDPEFIKTVNHRRRCSFCFSTCWMYSESLARSAIRSRASSASPVSPLVPRPCQRRGPRSVLFVLPIRRVPLQVSHASRSLAPRAAQSR